MNKIVEIKDITVGYDNKTILKNVNLTIRNDDFIGIIGPNGGGKTTLLKAILGLIPVQSGQINFLQNGEKVPDLHIGYVPQSNNIDRSFPINVYDVILSGLSGERSLFSKFSKSHRHSVEEMIKLLDLENLKKRPINQLSGGQLQRTFLGRALVGNPQLLILDEPNSYLDKDSEGKLNDLLQEISKSLAILMVSHNISSVRSMAKSLACVNGGLHFHPSTNIPTECLYEFY